MGKKIDLNFIKEIGKYFERYQISPSGEGGEIETFVLNCPLFREELIVKNRVIDGGKNSWRMEIELE